MGSGKPTDDVITKGLHFKLRSGRVTGYMRTPASLSHMMRSHLKHYLSEGDKQPLNRLWILDRSGDAYVPKLYDENK